MGCYIWVVMRKDLNKIFICDKPEWAPQACSCSPSGWTWTSLGHRRGRSGVTATRRRVNVITRRPHVHQIEFCLNYILFTSYGLLDWLRTYSPCVWYQTFLWRSSGGHGSWGKVFAVNGMNGTGVGSKLQIKALFSLAVFRFSINLRFPKVTKEMFLFYLKVCRRLVTTLVKSIWNEKQNGLLQSEEIITLVKKNSVNYLL